VTFLKKPCIEAVIKINVTSKLADILQQSLNPEIKSLTSERSIISISKIKDVIIVKINAGDVTALRAAVNSYLYWIQGIIDLTSKI
jgi:tRNA threonylcarbamoyladenosine modification (KEOPS) complex  Pcc1 subunit